ncbi:MAG: hypothetical protein MUE96_04490 [Bacteroidia bacterium]|jgi:hypothetical protein|nr:hypothetical protein [Bacteroidia bacterium]
MKNQVLTYCLLLLIINLYATKGLAQKYTSTSAFAVNTDLQYSIPYFGGNGDPFLGLRIGTEYYLGSGFLAKAQVNSGSFRGNFVPAENYGFTTFSNTYTQFNGSLGFNVLQFTESHFLSNIGLYLHVGGGYLFSDITAVRLGSGSKSFNKRFWMNTLGTELRVDVSKKISVNAAVVGNFSQTKYLDGINTTPTNHRYDWFLTPSVGITYRFIRQQPKPNYQTQYERENTDDFPTAPPVYNRASSGAAVTNGNGSNSAQPYSEKTLLDIAAILNRMVAQQDSVAGILKSQMKLDSVFYATYLYRDSMRLKLQDSLQDSSMLPLKAYFANANNEVTRFPILAGNTYNVVVATYSVYDIDKAIQFIKDHPEYNLYLISGNKNSTKVRVCNYSSDVFGNALKNLQLVRGELEQTAWIYKKK